MVAVLSVVSAVIPNGLNDTRTVVALTVVLFHPAVDIPLAAAASAESVTTVAAIFVC